MLHKIYIYHFLKADIKTIPPFLPTNKKYVKKTDIEIAKYRFLSNFADRNHLPKWLVLSGVVLSSLFCFIMAVSGNYILFRLSNKVYRNQKCKLYINNHLPQCMWANKMKFRLAEHSHQLTHILADKLFSFLKSLTMAD